MKTYRIELKISIYDGGDLDRLKESLRNLDNILVTNDGSQYLLNPCIIEVREIED